MRKHLSKAVLESSRLKKLKSQKIIRNALRGAATPITLEEIRALHTDNVLELETFYDNIGAIFPFVLGKVSEGLSIRKIEALIGMKPRSLDELLLRYKRLSMEVRQARKIRTDSNSPNNDIFQ